MNNEQYKNMVNELTPKPQKFKNSLIAFTVGGAIGLLGEIINVLIQNVFDIPMEESIIWTLIAFIIIASLFTAIGFFDNLVTLAKAGLIVPITGFAHSIASSALDYKKDGMITGLGANFFKLAGSVLLFGTVSAFILVILKVMIYG